MAWVAHVTSVPSSAPGCVDLLEAKPNRLLCPPIFTFHPFPYVFNNIFLFLLFLGKAMKLEEQKQDTERQLKALTKQMKVRL